MHADTAGTKTALAYIHWKETGDNSVWADIVQDAIVMNLDDLLCVGATGPIVLSTTIGRNKHLIPGEVLRELIQGTAALVDRLNEWGIETSLAGGETADVGDIVRTLDVGFTAFTRMRRDDVITIQAQPGDVIVGLASYGQAGYEDRYNSGIGSNGLTSARHDVLAKEYLTKYPEASDPGMDPEVAFTGSKRVTDLEEQTGMAVGKLLLSPTRTYAPFVAQLVRELKGRIKGMVHCTGGAQTKVLKFVNDLHVIKDNLLPIPPVFQLIHDESGTSWQEMYEVFNMGHRLEVYTSEADAQSVIDLANGLGIEAQVIGRCEPGSGATLALTDEHGTFDYSA
jgi:phosphoribosylformylglycinamidine cyclo-ligase